MEEHANCWDVAKVGMVPLEKNTKRIVAGNARMASSTMSMPVQVVSRKMDEATAAEEEQEKTQAADLMGSA